MTHPPLDFRSLASHLLAGALGSSLAALGGLSAAAPLAAQEPTPASPAAAAAAPDTGQVPAEPVSAIDAQAYLGYWLLTVRLGQNTQKFGLQLEDHGVDGDELSGKLVSGFGEMTAEKFALINGTLGFDLASDVGRFRVEIQVEDDALRGVFGDTAGAMRAEFSGERTDRLGFARFLVPDNESRIARGEQMVRLRFVSPAVDGPDFAQIARAKPGDVVHFVDDMAIKLTTDLPLVFGSLQVPTENVAAGYPGVYSLWLKRTTEGWNLVFNHKPDVWGTQHRPSADLGEVTLELQPAEQPSERLRGSLEETAAAQGEAVLRLIWGPHTWSARFRIESPGSAQPKRPASAG